MKEMIKALKASGLASIRSTKEIDVDRFHGTAYYVEVEYNFGSIVTYQEWALFATEADANEYMMEMNARNKEIEKIVKDYASDVVVGKDFGILSLRAPQTMEFEAPKYSYDDGLQYAIVKICVGTESYINSHLEQDIKDVYDYIVIDTKDIYDYDVVSIVRQSNNLEELKDSLRDIFEAEYYMDMYY